MGATISKDSKDLLKQYTANDVAQYVADMGEKYETYSTEIKSSGIDGSFLASLTKQTFEETLDCLEIKSRLHRRKLEREFEKITANNGFNRTHSNCMSTAASTGAASDISSRSCSTSLDLDKELSVSSQHSGSTSTRRSPASRRHRRAPSDVPIDMVMECALAANQIDKLTRAPTPKHTAAVLEAAIEAQALERENLQNDVLELEQERQLDSPPKDGLVAIVLTDVENSTQLWETNPEAMRDALILHDSLARQLREKNHGYEIDTEGDAFFLAFSDPCDALAFALDLQVALQEAHWSDEILATEWAGDDGERRGLKVRVSVHMGPVETMKNPVTGRTEYDGDGMDVAQEVEKMTRGGQILTTIDTWNAAFHLADVKLGSPTVAEFNKPLVLEDSMDSSIANMDGSVNSFSQVYKRIVELTPQSMKRLSTTMKAQKTQQSGKGRLLLRRNSLKFNTLANDSKVWAFSQQGRVAA